MPEARARERGSRAVDDAGPAPSGAAGAARAGAARSAASRRRRRAIAALAIVSVVLMLFPPIQWWLADGSAAVAIGYFVVSGLVVVGAVALIHRLDRAEEANRWTS